MVRAGRFQVRVGDTDLLVGTTSMKRKPETTEFWVGRLPHWEVVDGRYFVTIHLAGAIPGAGQRRIREITAELGRLSTNSLGQRLRIQRSIFREMERWLDRAVRNAHLNNRDVAQHVADAIRFRHEERIWNVFEWVVMPNHVHLFFELVNGRLKNVMEGFKRWTAHKAFEIITTDTETFWQREWFDHWSRSDDEDDRIIAYIQKNPVKAGLVTDYHDWPFGSGHPSRSVPPERTWKWYTSATSRSASATRTYWDREVVHVCHFQVRVGDTDLLG